MHTEMHIELKEERLFDTLLSGACTFQFLSTKLKFYFGTEDALRNRLAALVQGNYLRTMKYKDAEKSQKKNDEEDDNGVDNKGRKNVGKHALYVLGERGKKWLIDHRKAEEHEIRDLLPSPGTVAHELVVVSLARRVRRERDYIPYKLLYYDDPACRKVLKIKEPPDLLCEVRPIALTTHYGYRLGLEVHNTMPVQAVVKKALRQHEHQMACLTFTRDKYVELQEAMRKHPDLKGRVYFALMSDFCRQAGAIFGTNFYNWEGKPISLYPEFRKI
ncbi:MAG: hypothetical protein M0Z61_10090 [Nitrospiraceae bacterium]|nr:hypothetical protein [Nitrospiraceae bacterium]